MAPHQETVLVTIQRPIVEKRTRPDWEYPKGRRRFEIDAIRVADGETVWCSTLDAWMASLCQRAWETQRQLLLTIRMVTLHGQFGSRKKVFNLVNVENPVEQVSA